MFWIAQLEASDETVYARAYPAVSVDLQYSDSLVSHNTGHKKPIMTINEGEQLLEKALSAISVIVKPSGLL